MPAPKNPNTRAATDRSVAARASRKNDKLAAQLHAAGRLTAVRCFGWAHPWAQTNDLAKPVFIAQAHAEADRLGLELAATDPVEELDPDTGTWTLSWPLQPKPGGAAVSR